MNEKELSETRRIGQTAYGILFIVSFCHLLNDTMQSMIPALFPVLKEDFSLSFAQIGAITLVLQVTSSILQPFVGFYADKLCITPKYLSQISRSVTGLPASQWIQFYAVFELVSLLNDTTKTLGEVSDLMNFENISHFSRYTKRVLGKSPSEYRQK